MGEELTGKTVGDENDLKSPQISAQESNQEQQTEQMIKTVIDEDRTARSDEKGYWGNLGWGGRNIYQDWRDNHFERREMIIDAIKLSSLS